MADLWLSLLPALATGLLSLSGVYLANRKLAALMAYRIAQLEKKMDRHNSVLERMIALEGRVTALDRNVQSLNQR